MATKPILFSGPMVRAILDGRKTQTRRVIKLDIARDNRFPIGKNVVMNIRDPKAVEHAPYRKGDVLWVRETYGLYNPGNPENGLPNRDEVEIIRPATDDVPEVAFDADDMLYDNPRPLPMRPSIHMPKWACRLFLKVTNVRAEWLRDISMKDCLAEGVGELADHGSHFQNGSHLEGTFRALWDSLNAKRGFGWDKSPWVWVYEFERCDKPAGWPVAIDSKETNHGQEQAH
jgi:hypothetical protein